MRVDKNETLIPSSIFCDKNSTFKRDGYQKLRIRVQEKNDLQVYILPGTQTWNILLCYRALKTKRQSFDRIHSFAFRKKEIMNTAVDTSSKHFDVDNKD